MRWLEEVLGIQIVHWPGLWTEIVPSNGGAFPLRGPKRGCIYRWRFRVLGVEIRKWGR